MKISPPAVEIGPPPELFPPVVIPAGVPFAEPNGTCHAMSPVLTSIAVTPINPIVAQGLTEQFTATATYTDGSTADLTSSVTWTSANTIVASINGTGLAAALASGSSTISATSGVVVGTSIVTVTSGSPTTPTITWANPADIVYGTALSGTQLDATATSQSGGDLIEDRRHEQLNIRPTRARQSPRRISHVNRAAGQPLTIRGSGRSTQAM